MVRLYEKLYEIQNLLYEDNGLKKFLEIKKPLSISNGMHPKMVIGHKVLEKLTVAMPFFEAINPNEPSDALKQPTFFPNSDSFCQ